MERIRRVSLIGLGAVGAAYGSRLLMATETELSVVVDRTRKDRYRERPVVVNGQDIAFSYVLPDEDVEPADLVLIAVKYDGLAQALKDIRRHVGPNTIFISLLNGIASEDDIRDVYPNNPILHAVCIAIDAVRSGSDVTFSSLGYISFGDASGQQPDIVERVRELFERAGIGYEVPADILRTMWWKFMINVGINQTSAILRAPYGVFQQSTDAHTVMAMAMREVIAIARQLGIELSEDDIDRFDDVLYAMAPTGKTSMLQDVEAGRPTEVEQLSGRVLQIGRQLGVPTPVNEVLYRAIRAITPASP
ncbi:ketopantoate reductase family protein [Alicyclobacillus sacchari]|nr:ketopantoate reductase family protein [Alicyclobacillus sacchari]